VTKIEIQKKGNHPIPIPQAGQDLPSLKRRGIYCKTDTIKNKQVSMIYFILQFLQGRRPDLFVENRQFKSNKAAEQRPVCLYSIS